MPPIAADTALLRPGREDDDKHPRRDPRSERRLRSRRQRDPILAGQRRRTTSIRRRGPYVRVGGRVDARRRRRLRVAVGHGGNPRAEAHRDLLDRTVPRGDPAAVRAVHRVPARRQRPAAARIANACQPCQRPPRRRHPRAHHPPAPGRACPTPARAPATATPRGAAPYPDARPSRRGSHERTVLRASQQDDLPQSRGCPARRRKQPRSLCAR